MPARGGIGFAGLIAAGLVLFSAAFVGCGGSDNDTNSENLIGPEAAAANLGSDLTLGPPDLREVESLLRLTEEQARQLEQALMTWREAMQARRESFPGMGDRGPRGGDSRRDGGFGGERPGGWPGRDVGSGPMAPEGGLEGHEPLHLGFLADCAGFLNQDQFVTLADFLSERQAARREEVRQERERRGHGRMGRGCMRFARELDLTEEQRTEFGEAFRESHEALRSLMKEHADGTLGAEELRSGAGEIREQLSERLTDILDEGQYELLLELMGEARATMAERRLDNLGDGIDRHVELLTRMLDLEEGQALEIKSRLTGLLPRREALLTGIRDGNIQFEDALYESVLIREETIEAIRAPLTEEQRERLDALRPLISHRRGRVRLYL
jgi:hypothetical protein